MLIDIFTRNPNFSAKKYRQPGGLNIPPYLKVSSVNIDILTDQEFICKCKSGLYSDALRRYIRGIKYINLTKDIPAYVSSTTETIDGYETNYSVSINTGLVVTSGEARSDNEISLKDFKSMMTISEDELKLFDLKSVSFDTWKSIRDLKVSKLTTEVNGKIFDADENSQNRLLRALVYMEHNKLESIKWKLANNSINDITLDELKLVISKSFSEQSNIWI